MTSITWLHISDLHVWHPRYGYDYEEVAKKLVDDLNRLKDEHNLIPDMIFFTGDAVFGQKSEGEGKSIPEQYEEANKFLESIRTTFGESFPKKNFFLVPGNHDINLTVDNKSLILWLREKADLLKLTEMIHEPGSLWQSYITKFKEYEEFLKTYGYEHLIGDPSKAIYSDIREFGGIKVGIAGFNSAWSSSGKGKKEKGKLWLDGERQLSSFRSFLHKANFSIALMHHPLSWFSKKESSFFQHKLEPEFKFLLHGHYHTSWVTQINEHNRIAAGTCYHNPDKEAGYNFVRLNIEEGKGEVWLRKYDPSEAGEWVPYQTGDGQTDQMGRYYLMNVAWLKDMRDALSIGAGIGDGATSSSRVYEIPCIPERTRFETFRSDLFLPPRLIQKFYETIHRMDKIELHEEVFQGGPTRIKDMFLPKEDIDFQIVEVKKDIGVPFEEKEPWLQELRTEEQIRKHFVPLPKFFKHMDEWISKDRDILLFGPPFCGKTSLLTFLSLEAKRRYGDQLPIVRFKPSKDLKSEEIEGAVTRLLQRLDHMDILGKKNRAILVIDNVHEPGVFAITRELLKSPHQCRVWGAARCSEFDEILSRGEENPWSKKGIIKNDCELIEEKDVDYFTDYVLKPLLITNGEGSQIDEVKTAIKSMDQTPIRFLCQVWKLIKDRRFNRDLGYSALLRKEPTGVDETVRSILPYNIPGLKAIAIAAFLQGPSWELLTYVLSKTESFGDELAASTIKNMRQSLALLNDPEEPNKVFMYAQVQEEICRPGNLSDFFANEIWTGIQGFLKDWKHVKEQGSHEKLCTFWLSLSDLAKDNDQKEIAVNSAERALEYASGEQEVKALFEIALATNRLKGKWCEDTINLLWRAVEKSGQLEKVTLDAAYAKAILGNLFLNIDPPNIERAISFLHEAKNACEFLGADSDVGHLNKMLALAKINQGDSKIMQAVHHARQALETYRKIKDIPKEIESLYLLAYCLRMQSKPDWDQAITCYREALDLLKTPEQQADRARALYQMVFCLHNQFEPDWSAAIEASRESVKILRGLEDTQDLIDHLIQFAWLCHNQDKPNWEEAISCYQETLKLLKAPEQYTDRALIFYLLGHCLYNQPEPDWTRSIMYFQEALKLQQNQEQNIDLALTFYHLAFCFHNQPKPDWEAAISCYQDALKLLTEPLQQTERAEALFHLAYCLYNQPNPDWAGAIDCYQGALELLTDPEKREERSESFYQMAFCLHNQPNPDWTGAITCYQGALELLTDTELQIDRAMTLYQLAFCLHNQPDPDWVEAITHYREALEIFTDPEHRADRAMTLYQLAFCLHNQPDPDWAEGR
jgi:tetratricopeptide (TPR) repeat protein/predicted MPP superfamily phosphohydrolase